MRNRLLMLLAGMALLQACASAPSRDPAYAATRPTAQPPAAQEATGSIYQAGYAVALFEDQRARRPGDTLTVRLVEKTAASKQASTSTKKDDSVDISNPTILGSVPQFNAPGFLPLASNRNNNLSVSVDASRKFTGEGDSSQGNSLTGDITVTVAEVLANGNLVIRGEKLLSLNQGHEHIRIAGIVRPADIRTDNSVLSTQVADARISYGGSGALADANRQGWLTRVFNSPWWPF